MDPYKILGVPRSSDEKTIKRAYRKKCIELHPDKHPGDPKAQDRFKEVTAAYHILSDPKRRHDYEKVGGAEQSEKFRKAKDRVERDVIKFMDIFGQFLGDLVGDPEAGSGNVEVRKKRDDEPDDPIEFSDDTITVRQGGVVIRVKKTKS